MALRDLVKKSKTPKSAKVAGEEFKYVEFTPQEDADALRMARKRFKEIYTEGGSEEQENNFVSAYKTYLQVKAAGDDISEVEFFALSEYYIQEMTLAIHFQSRKDHPEYYSQLEELQKKAQAPYQDLIKAVANLKKTDEEKK